MKYYYPFGMGMPGRSYTGTSYSFGYQGSIKDDEIFSSSGTSYTTLFRELAPRLGRWWSIDPKLKSYESPYASMGNNPIWFNDPNGDDLDVNPTDKQAKQDVNDLAKTKNQKFIQIDDKTGKVSLDFGKLSQKQINKIVKNDQGLGIIKELVDAKDPVQVKLSNSFMETTGQVDAMDRSGNTVSIPFPVHSPGYVTTSPDFFLNLSTTPYSAKNPYLLPKVGYDGQVMVAPGYKEVDSQEAITDKNGVPTGGYKTVITKCRTETIMHELSENYLRTVKKLPYDDAHKAATFSHGYSRFIFK